jgi:hypothetical protein
VATIRHYEQHPERRVADSERMKKFCSENPEWGKAQNERLTAVHTAKRKAKEANDERTENNDNTRDD